MEGIVFDIQRFALHDGPGIRTTVFLKGCSLRCAWCCNPESLLLHPQLAYRESKCTQCMKCVPKCPQQVFNNLKGKLSVDFGKCKQSGQCLRVCIPDALKIYGYKISSDDLLKEILKDKSYFENSGGGVTLSGGDPIVQFDFSFEVAQMIKREKLNLCIETAGFGNKDYFLELAKYTDLFLFDFKHFDSSQHIKYTRVDNSSILRNLELLYGSGAKIRLRCPIIPGVNDTKSHFHAIVELGKKYPDLEGIELMPYHDYGAVKYKDLGMPDSGITVKSVSKETAKKWEEEMRKMNCNKLIQKQI
jgi:pyruvate formate lyase activating enzyme